MVFLNLGCGRSYWPFDLSQPPPHRQRVLPTPDTFSDPCGISDFTSSLGIWKPQPTWSCSQSHHWAEPGRASFVGLIEYSGRTLGVLMLRLRGLFNSAYRHRKTHVSAMLLRLQFGGSVEAVTVSSFSRPLRVPRGSIPTGGWTPDLTYAYYGRPELPVCAGGRSEEATKKKLFPKQVAEEFNQSFVLQTFADCD